MNNFNQTQKDRLAVESKLAFWANRWKDVTHPRLRSQIDVEAKNTVMQYISQVPAMDYHMDKYRRLKK